jgi:hypothetical protein
MNLYWGQMDALGPGDYYNARSIALFLLLTAMAALAWPCGPGDRKERDDLLLIYPLLVFAYWFLFQLLRLSLVPGQRFLANEGGGLVWLTNSLICLGFGVIFSVGILCQHGVWRRLYGGLFTGVFAMLISMTLNLTPGINHLMRFIR